MRITKVHKLYFCNDMDTKHLFETNNNKSYPLKSCSQGNLWKNVFKLITYNF